jgi:hypothetical protein
MNFEKKIETVLKGYSGAGGKGFIKKLEAEHRNFGNNSGMPYRACAGERLLSYLNGQDILLS